MRRSKAGFYRLLMVLVVVTAAELCSRGALFALEKWRRVYYHPVPFKLTETGRTVIQAFINDESPNTKLDAALGWAPKPSKTVRFAGSDPKTETISPQGIRGNRIYSLAPNQGIVRIAAFGDSYTFGSAVSDDECWTEVMSLGEQAVEVLNFGVAGYGLDQAFLRYQEEGAPFHPHVVLICYMTENLARHVNVFPAFYMHVQTMPVSKPRFVVERGALRLLGNPLRTPKDYQELLHHERESLTMLGQNDYFYRRSARPAKIDALGMVRLVKVIRRIVERAHSVGSLYERGYYNTDSEAFKVTVRLIEEFDEAVLRNGSAPVVVIFPHRGDIDRHRMDGSKSYQPLLEHLTRAGMEPVDLMEALQSAARSREVPALFDSEGGGHYSPLGNEIVAEHLLKCLEKRELLDVDTMVVTPRIRTAEVGIE